MATMTLVLSAPEEADDVERIVAEAREQAVLDLLRRGRISAGRGAELTGMPVEDFLLWMSERGVSPFGDELTADDLRAEAERVGRPVALSLA